MNKTIRELADALYDCFCQDDQVDTYNDAQVAKIMKKKIGKKDFELYDQLEDKDWYEAWRTFDMIVAGKLKR